MLVGWWSWWPPIQEVGISCLLRGHWYCTSGNIYACTTHEVPQSSSICWIRLVMIGLDMVGLDRQREWIWHTNKIKKLSPSLGFVCISPFHALPQSIPFSYLSDLWKYNIEHAQCLECESIIYIMFSIEILLKLLIKRVTLAVFDCRPVAYLNARTITLRKTIVTFQYNIKKTLSINTMCFHELEPPDHRKKTKERSLHRMIFSYLWAWSQSSSWNLSKSNFIHLFIESCLTPTHIF